MGISTATIQTYQQMMDKEPPLSSAKQAQAVVCQSSHTEIKFNTAALVAGVATILTGGTLATTGVIAIPIAAVISFPSILLMDITKVAIGEAAVGSSMIFFGAMLAHVGSKEVIVKSDPSVKKSQTVDTLNTSEIQSKKSHTKSHDLLERWLDNKKVQAGAICSLLGSSVAFGGALTMGVATVLPSIGETAFGVGKMQGIVGGVMMGAGAIPPVCTGIGFLLLKCIRNLSTVKPAIAKQH